MQFSVFNELCVWDTYNSHLLEVSVGGEKMALGPPRFHIAKFLLISLILSWWVETNTESHYMPRLYAQSFEWIPSLDLIQGMKKKNESKII